MSDPSTQRTIDVCTEIEQERFRQIKQEGFDAAHDDAHSSGQMATAAGCYAIGAAPGAENSKTYVRLIEAVWPWSFQWWRPSDARKRLIKAGALIVAEIERLDRASEKEQANG